MTSTRRLRRALLACTLLTPLLAAAQGNWPEKPVRLIVPYPPGGGTDVIARIVEQHDATARGWLEFSINNVKRRLDVK